MKRQVKRRHEKVRKLLEICESEPDFWPGSRRFLNVGEHELAAKGLYLYLLQRDDLWQEHLALIKAVKRDLSGIVDFDALELTALDGGRYDEVKATLEWRAEVIEELERRTQEKS